MRQNAVSPSDRLETLLPVLGSVLSALYEEGQGKEGIPHQRLMEHMVRCTNGQEDTLLGALAVLRGLGLVYVDAYGRVSSTSRYACYALGSLSKFLGASVAAFAEASEDAVEEKHLVSLTAALESTRKRSSGVDTEPLHSRTIVNVLIKSRQVRQWRSQDVYLHVRHPGWGEYHLVGLSRTDETGDDEGIARRALEDQVGLMPDQYELDPTFNPPAETDRRVSATSGALTEYTYHLQAIRKVKIRLRLQELVEDGQYDSNWFRWFTWEEMKTRRSEQGEPIMFSVATLMTQEQLSAIPIRAASADDVRRAKDSINVLDYLRCRVTRGQLRFLGVALLVPALLIGPVPRALTALGHSCPLLDNLGSVADVLSVVLALSGLLSGGASAALSTES